MKFRPCIDIHNGKVKQIVGGSLLDQGDQADENFVSDRDGGFYARLYKDHGLTGGHIILLNPADSQYYEEDVEQARGALSAYPGGMQIGGGMTAENAKRFLDMGASHIIVTSYVFKNGQIDYDHLEAIRDAVGKEHLVLDLSCRKKDGQYYVVTDRWQKYTDVVLNKKTLTHLAAYCDEFLIHAVDVEGKASGIEEELVRMIGDWNEIPVTYAGGVRNEQDLALLKESGHGQLDVTIGSALDLFGGDMKFEKVLEYCD